MIKRVLPVVFAIGLMFASAGALAQRFEVVHSLDYPDTASAKAALDVLFADGAMSGGKATMYALDLGDGRSSHLVVEDFERYADRVSLDDKRRASHGWSKYLLATQDSEYLGSELVTVVDDHGKPRHTAKYLAAFLVRTTDAATYRSALKEMNDAIGNPGVLRLVAARSGGRDVTHAVLIGGEDFAAVNEYLDKLFASDAFQRFLEKVRDTREVVGVHMYRRIGTWGYQ